MGRSSSCCRASSIESKTFQAHFVPIELCLGSGRGHATWSRGRGFKSCRVLDCIYTSSFFPTLLQQVQCSILVPSGRCLSFCDGKSFTKKWVPTRKCQMQSWEVFKEESALKTLIQICDLSTFVHLTQVKRRPNSTSFWFNSGSGPLIWSISWDALCNEGYCCTRERCTWYNKQKDPGFGLKY